MKDGDWYWINKTVLKIYAKSAGPAGIAVYNVLALFANAKTQTCYPTHRTIGKMLDMSKRSVIRQMRELEMLGLIRRERQKGQTVYYLLDVKQVPKMTPGGERYVPDG